MVVLDIFIVRRVTAQSSGISIERLRQSMDPSAPVPLMLFSPTGEEIFLFFVDFHCSPRETCERMGFDYRHLHFLEYLDEYYVPSNHIRLSQDYHWVKAFIIAWFQDTLVE
jgi:hypothetical protein